MKYWTAAASVIALSTGVGLAGATSVQAPQGEQIFKQRCQACHSVVAGRSNPMGPALAGIVGRDAASAPFAYSPALKKLQVRWTRENLDRYLAGPAKMVLGTRMMVSVNDPAQRKAVIDYLATTR